jgi:hypothetical protein
MKDKKLAIILAVFFGIFAWIYTWKVDAWKFWLGLGLAIVLCWTLIVPFGIWMWVLIDMIRRPSIFYKRL